MDWAHDSLSKAILQGTLEGGQCRGWQRKCWMDNVKEWTSLHRPELLTTAPAAAETRRGSLLNYPLCHPPKKKPKKKPNNDLFGQGTELNWTYTEVFSLKRIVGKNELKWTSRLAVQIMLWCHGHVHNTDTRWITKRHLHLITHCTFSTNIPSYFPQVQPSQETVRLLTHY